MHALIVDDHADIRELLFIALKLKGFDCETASSAASAIECFDLALQTDNDFDLVLLDVSMPERSGYDVAAHIKASGARTKVLMLTGLTDDPLVKAHALHVGVSNVLTKPVEISELYERIEQMLSISNNVTV